VYVVYAIKWTEYERGWGNRPDGISYHASKEDAENFIKTYWDGMPDVAPYCYSSPGYAKLIEVEPEIWHTVQIKRNIWA